MKSNEITTVFVALAVLLAISLSACVDVMTPLDDAGMDADADADTDTDADADTDTDTDTDADTDSDTDADTDTDSDTDTDTDTVSDTDSETESRLTGVVFGRSLLADGGVIDEVLPGVRVYRFFIFQWPDSDVEDFTDDAGVYELAGIPLVDPVSHVGRSSPIVAEGDAVYYGDVNTEELAPGDNERHIYLLAREHVDSIADGAGVSIDHPNGIFFMRVPAGAQLAYGPAVPADAGTGDLVDRGGGDFAAFNVPDEWGNGYGFAEFNVNWFEFDVVHDCQYLRRTGEWNDHGPGVYIDEHVSHVRVHCQPDLLVNEIHNCATTDVNGDGDIDDGDRFVELLNTTGEEIDIAGWTLEDGYGAVMHEFPPGAHLDSGAAFVVWDSFSPYVEPANGACYMGAGAGALSLDVLGGTMVVRDDIGRVVDEAVWDPAGLPCGVSLGRPIQFDVAFEPHDQLCSAPPCADLSVGQDADGGDFAACSGLNATVTISEALTAPATDVNGDLAVDDGDEFIEIVNTSAGAVHLENWTLETGAGVPLHTFDGTIVIGPMASTMVFGGPVPALAAIDGACAYTASEGPMGLPDVQGEVVLRDQTGEIVDGLAYDLTGVGPGISAARPHLGSYSVLDHCSASDAVPCEDLSPGAATTSAETYVECLGVEVTLSGIVEDNSGPVAGVDVYVDEYPAISWTTSADGAYELSGIPSNEVVRVLATPSTSDHWGNVTSFEFFGADEDEDLQVTETALVDAILGSLGTTLDPGTGILIVGAIPGTRITLPAAPAAPSIVSDGGVFEYGDTVLPGGEQVIFVNVPPGGFDAGVTPPSGVTCELNGMDPDAFGPALVVDAHMSRINYICD